jgi:predicted RNA methylase
MVKELIIKKINAEIASMKEFSQSLDDINIYTETGHVDTDFFVKLLEGLTSIQCIYQSIMGKFEKGLIGEDVLEAKKTDAADTGKIASPEEILKRCTLEDNILRLPKIRFNKKVYAKVKQYIEEAGGQWTGGKVQGFSFPFDARRVFSVLKEGKRFNIQQEYQFFETPARIADWLVSLIEIKNTHTILEPSAGRGALIHAIHRVCPEVVIDCFELMPENRELLAKVKNIRLLGEDFICKCNRTYDVIIANPPFANHQDVEHVRKMYDCLNTGGVVAAIMGTNWKFDESSKSKKIREWTKEVNATIYDIEKGRFKQSGTTIATTAIVIYKK